MKNLMLLLCVLFFFASCNNSTNSKKDLLNTYKRFDYNNKFIKNIRNNTKPLISAEPNTVIRVEEGNKTSKLEGINIIDTCWYVPLETNNESVLGTVDKLVIDNGLYFIYDRNTEDLFVFNSEGKFVNKIGKKGKGPGEFLRINDFACDKSKKQIIIHDDRTAKLLYYNYQGEFIKEKNTSFRFSNIHVSDNTIYFYLGQNSNKHIPILENYFLAAFKKDSCLGTYLPYKKNFKNYCLEDQFSGSGKHLSISSPLIDNNIYTINNGELTKEYFLDFGQKSFNENLIESLEKQESLLGASRNLNADLYLGNHYETQNTLYFSFYSNAKLMHAYYDKAKKKTLVWERFIPNDPYSISIMYPQNVIFDENIFIGWHEASMFSKHKEHVNKDGVKKSKEVERLCKTLKKTDNPVLCFFKIKSNE